MVDKTGLPNIDPQTSQAVNPETSTRLRELVDEYLAVLDVAGEVRLELSQEIEAARADGHSFAQLNEASGLSIATIQKILVAVAVERASSKSPSSGPMSGRSPSSVLDDPASRSLARD